MLQTIKENKKSIVISFVIAIIIFYLQPLLAYIGAAIVIFLSQLAKTLLITFIIWPLKMTQIAFLIL